MPENQLLNKAVALLYSEDCSEFTSYINKIAEYCIENENGKVFDEWNEETIRQLIAYHYIKETLVVLVNENKEIQGVFMWYNCNNDYTWDFVKEWKEDVEGGDSIFMAFLFASNSEAFKELTLMFIRKEPDVLYKKLIGVRNRSGWSTRVDYDQKLLSRLLKLKD